MVQESQRKNDIILPTYVSPYNKQMLGSGLPLKTLINKTKAHRRKHHKNRKKKNTISELENSGKVSSVRSISRGEVVTNNMEKEIPIREGKKIKYTSHAKRKKGKASFTRNRTESFSNSKHSRTSRTPD